MTNNTKYFIKYNLILLNLPQLQKILILSYIKSWHKNLLFQKELAIFHPK